MILRLSKWLLNDAIIFNMLLYYFYKNKRTIVNDVNFILSNLAKRSITVLLFLLLLFVTSDGKHTIVSDSLLWRASLIKLIKLFD